MPAAEFVFVSCIIFDDGSGARASANELRELAFAQQLTNNLHRVEMHNPNQLQEFQRCNFLGRRSQSSTSLIAEYRSASRVDSVRAGCAFDHRQVSHRRICLPDAAWCAAKQLSRSSLINYRGDAIRHDVGSSCQTPCWQALALSARRRTELCLAQRDTAAAYRS